MSSCCTLSKNTFFAKKSIIVPMGAQGVLIYHAMTFFTLCDFFDSAENGCDFLSHNQRRTYLKKFNSVCIKNNLFPPEDLYYGRVDTAYRLIRSTRGLWMQVLGKK